MFNDTKNPVVFPTFFLRFLREHDYYHNENVKTLDHHHFMS
jgi:hypothetical protein